MTDPNPEDSTATHEPSSMPRWVPILIGATLMVMAALAVYTGLRDRDDDTILAHVRPRRQRAANTPAPPGEPGAGASLVLHGASGENTPAANEPVRGQSRAVVTGGPGGVSSVVRIWARRGMVLNVLPDDTVVYVNELPIGQAKQFNTMDEAYEFAAAGSYNVKLVAPSGAEKTYIVTASDDAQQDVARISVKL
ncbi:MAG TPA: hypothetical protein VGQ36_28525 [Thermoanaerobaculia bacterium]|jgi:hypothetical protein|nr:hypothetical protein [Thermoanaerobaculia bacterium]